MWGLTMYMTVDFGMYLYGKFVSALVHVEQEEMTSEEPHYGDISRITLV